VVMADVLLYSINFRPASCGDVLGWTFLVRDQLITFRCAHSRVADSQPWKSEPHTHRDLATSIGY
jgi:hypothetical protein